mgnify:CR=1 FL=1
MNITDLRYVQELAHERNFSKAAEKLFITQSALSQQIKKIEEELGFTLFRRTSKMVELTESGTEFLKYADRVLADFSELEKAASQIRSSKKNRMVFGASPYISPLLSELLPDYLVSHPEIEFRLVEAVNKDLLEMVRKNEVDLAIYPVVQSSGIDDKIQKYVIREEFVYTIMSATHPLADRTSVTLEDIVPYQLIFSSSRTGIKDIVMQAFEDSCLTPKEPFDLTSKAARIPYLKGGAITFSMSSINEWANDENFVRIPLDPRIYISVCMILAPERSLTEPMKDILERFRGLQVS